jgi:glutathione S-transferase
MDATFELKDCKLEYFNGNGKGALIRALLHFKNIAFEDIKHSFEDWFGVLKKSGNYEFDQLPLFESNGQRYVQTSAIIMLLARKFELLGSNLNEEYLNTSLLASLDDFSPKLYPAYYPRTDEERARVEEAKKELAEVHCPRLAKIFENRFKKYAGKYAVGDSFSLSDVILTVYMHHVFKNSARKEVFEPILNQYAPNLAKHVERISQNELSQFFAQGYVNEVAL